MSLEELYNRHKALCNRLIEKKIIAHKHRFVSIEDKYFEAILSKNVDNLVKSHSCLLDKDNYVENLRTLIKLDEALHAIKLRAHDRIGFDLPAACEFYEEAKDSSFGLGPKARSVELKWPGVERLSLLEGDQVLLEQNGKHLFLSCKKTERIDGIRLVLSEWLPLAPNKSSGGSTTKLTKDPVDLFFLPMGTHNAKRELALDLYSQRPILEERVVFEINVDMNVKSPKIDLFPPVSKGVPSRLIEHSVTRRNAITKMLEARYRPTPHIFVGASPATMRATLIEAIALVSLCTSDTNTLVVINSQESAFELESLLVIETPETFLKVKYGFEDWNDVSDGGRVSNSMLENARLVLATTTGAGNLLARGMTFDYVFLYDAQEISEIDSLMAIMLTSRTGATNFIGHYNEQSEAKNSSTLAYRLGLRHQSMFYRILKFKRYQRMLGQHLTSECRIESKLFERQEDEEAVRKDYAQHLKLWSIIGPKIKEFTIGGEWKRFQPIPDEAYRVIVARDLKLFPRLANSNIDNPLSPRNYRARLESFVELDAACHSLDLRHYTFPSPPVPKTVFMQAHFDDPMISEFNKYLNPNSDLPHTFVNDDSTRPLRHGDVLVFQQGEKIIFASHELSIPEDDLVRFRKNSPTAGGRIFEEGKPFERQLVCLGVDRERLDLVLKYLDEQSQRIMRVLFEGGTRNSIKDPKLDLKLKQNEALLKRMRVKLTKEQCKAVVGIIEARCRPMPYILISQSLDVRIIVIMESIVQVCMRDPKAKVIVITNSEFRANQFEDVIGEIPAIRMGSEPFGKKLVRCGHTNSMRTPSRAEMLDHQQVLVATHREATVLLACSRKFDYVFLDEAHEADELDMLTALLVARKNGAICLVSNQTSAAPEKGRSLIGRIRSELSMSMGLHLAPFVRFIKFNCYRCDKKSGYDPQFIANLPDLD